MDHGAERAGDALAERASLVTKMRLTKSLARDQHAGSDVKVRCSAAARATWIACTAHSAAAGEKLNVASRCETPIPQAVLAALSGVRGAAWLCTNSSAKRCSKARAARALNPVQKLDVFAG